MARGLSPLQKDILRVLDRNRSALTVEEILMQLDVDLCPQSRPKVVHNSLRRALARLWERGLVMRTAETRYQDGGRYSHSWALPIEGAINRHGHYEPPYLISDRCPLHAIYGNVVQGRWEPTKETNRDAITAMLGMPARVLN